MKKSIAFFLAILFIFTSCKKNVEVKGSNIVLEDSKVLKIGVPFFEESLDPALNINGWFLMEYGVGEALIMVDENMELKPWLAEDFKMIDDKTWEFTIKDKVKFHNDRVMTAEDVKNSLERTLRLNPKASIDFKDAIFSAQNNILKITTAKIDPLVPNKLSDPMYIIVDTKENEENFWKNPICTGAYMLKEFLAGEKAIMMPFENYRDGKGKLSSVEFVHIADANTRMMAVQSGDIDVTININASNLDMFRNFMDFEVDLVPSTKLMYLMFNPSNEFLSDKRIRDAINHAIDKKSLCEIVLNYSAVPANSPYPYNLPFYSEKIEGYSYDVSKAKTLLEEAGFEDLDNNGILERDGKNLKLKLTNYSSRAEIPVITQFIQGELLKIGIETEIETYDKLPVEQYNAGNFDIGFDAFSVATSSDPKRLLDIAFVTGASDNYTNYYNNEKIDEISKILETESDLNKRYELAYEAQKIIVDDGFNVFLCFTSNNTVRKKGVENMYMHPLDYYRINSDTDYMK